MYWSIIHELRMNRFDNPDVDASLYFDDRDIMRRGVNNRDLRHGSSEGCSAATSSRYQKRHGSRHQCKPFYHSPVSLHGRHA